MENREIARQIKGWFDARRFETQAFAVGDGFVLKARKASKLRAAVGADRALEVRIVTQNGRPDVTVSHGSWKTNAVSNTAWLVATGGANLLISGWSVVVKKELELFVQGLLEGSGGAVAVQL